MQLDARGAELFFQVLLDRAVIDRVTFNAHIIETGSESYRHRTSRARRSRRDG